MKTIIHVVHVHASPPQVYDALTTAEGLSQWWITQVAVDAGPGGIIRFTFHGDFHPTMQQTALEPHRRVQWTCIAGYPNWQDNTIALGKRLPSDTATLAIHKTRNGRGTTRTQFGYFPPTPKPPHIDGPIATTHPAPTAMICIAAQSMHEPRLFRH